MTCFACENESESESTGSHAAFHGRDRDRDRGRLAHSFFEGKSVVTKCKSGTKQKRLLYLIQNTIHTSSQI